MVLHGGWTRVAYLNMTEPSAACPDELQQLTYNTIDHPLCGRRTSPYSGCSSTNFTSAALNYTEVCGQVRGYQYGSPHAFYTPSAGIESYYVDGISITHGQNPRHHIWTYAGEYQSQNVDQWSCPCNTGYNGGRNPGSYVGNHYYCESGVPAGNGYQNILYPNDILWDGKQCDGFYYFLGKWFLPFSRIKNLSIGQIHYNCLNLTGCGYILGSHSHVY